MKKFPVCKPLSLFIIGFLLMINGCKKGSKNPSEQTSQPPVLTIIENTSLANKTDSLIGVLDYSQYGIKYNFFGDFNNLGQPDKIKQVVVTRGDTALNFTFDENMRVKKLYFSLKSIKDTLLLEYDYSGGDIILNRYYVDWTNNLALLRNQTVVKNTGDTAFTVTNSVNFRVSGTQGGADFFLGVVKIVVVAGVFTAATIAGASISPWLGAAIGIGGFINLIQSKTAKAAENAEIKTSQTANSTSLPPPPQNYTYSIKVLANSEWPTGAITVKASEHLTITATGTWTHGVGMFGPNGFTTTGGSISLLPGEKIGALIARINGGQPFLVGVSKNLTTPVSGTLQFSMNDEYGGFTNNSGQLTVSVTKQ